MQVSFNLSQIPKNMGGYRLGNLYLFFDNLSDELSFLNIRSREVRFPIKSESMMTLNLIEGYMHLKVNLQDVEVHGGQTLSLFPGCIFQVLERSESLRYFCMMLAPEVIDSIQKSFGIHIDLAHRYYNFSVNDVPQETQAIGLEMYNLIKQELRQPDYEFKKEVLQRYCEIWILKSVSSKEGVHHPELRKPVGRKEQIFRDFLTLLEQHFTQERSISFYADRLCLTPKYLSTIVKEVSGKHGMQWIDDYVALEAKALLREGTMSVKQVSDKLNFPSQSMFGRFFKKMTGYSPKQYMLL